MQLLDIVRRRRFPLPWTEGDNIPWNDPGFSQRMLREHLSQEHDLASRRDAIIDAHVALIHSAMLQGRPSKVLDLGCGPGLYTNRLARLHHICTGVDFSPASVAYANDVSANERLPATHILSDVRTADWGGGYDLVMMLYGEFNVFKPADARGILERCWASLLPGGKILLEPSTFEGIRAQAGQRSWWALEQGLFSDRPHLGFEESFWDAAVSATTVRSYIVDAETAAVTRYASSYQAYSRDAYATLLQSAGFTNITFREALSEAHPQEGFLAVSAERPVG